jgi:hypothetical protein
MQSVDPGFKQVHLGKLGKIIKLIASLLHGWVNLTLTGANGNAHVTLNYDNHDQHIVPTIIEPFELKFKAVDVKLDNSYAINGLTTVLKVIFPRVGRIYLFNYSFFFVQKCNIEHGLFYVFST